MCIYTDKDCFGPILWNILHRSCLYFKAHGYEDLKSMYMAIISFGSLVPCQECKRHYEDIVRVNIPEISRLVASNRSFECSVWLHNIVNRRLGKPEVDVNEALSIHS